MENDLVIIENNSCILKRLWEQWYLVSLALVIIFEYEGFYPHLKSTCIHVIHLIIDHVADHCQGGLSNL